MGIDHFTIIVWGLAIVIAALVAAVPAILTLQRKVSRVERNSHELRDQVGNDHRHPDGTPILMRQENDERHAAVMGKLAAMEQNLNGITRTIGGMQRDIGRLADVDRDLGRRIDRQDDRIDDTWRRNHPRNPADPGTH